MNFRKAKKADNGSGSIWLIENKEQQKCRFAFDFNVKTELTVTVK